MGRRNKPRYIDRGYVASGHAAPSYMVDATGTPRTGALPAEPPFVFRAVTSRVFPLKANMARLTGFCDQYLNMDIPATIAHFRPSLPYVYLMVLNYGSMAAETVGAQNVGWVSQHEMTFTMPLEWWREENGRMVFKDWACVSPFIFVDDEMSLTTGREVYGWPKVKAQVDADVPPWTRNPQSGERLFSLSVPVFPKLFAGRHEVPRVLLQIDRAPSPSYSTIPFDPYNPWNPLTVLADASRAWLGLTQDALDMLWAPRIRGYSGQRSIDSMLAMYERAGSNMLRVLPDVLWPFPYRDGATQPSVRGAPRLSIQNITLKQFRAVEDPNEACYQALVSSRMGFDRLNQTGLLGDLNLLRGDPSGGFTVRIHRYPSQPIIESLGLDVVSEYKEGDGARVAILRPTLPFWTDVDLHYDKGKVICSRVSGFDSPDDTPPAKWIDEQDGQQDSPARAPGTKPAKVAYNTALGAATQPVSGPFTFPDVTMQVFPLLADRQQLSSFVKRYMNELVDPIGMHFAPYGAYVYMLLNVCDDQLGSMWSSSNNIGWWAEREVSFVVPVKWYYRNQLLGLALLTPFVYANNGRAVITDREVNGRPTVAAKIEHLPDVWLTKSGPVAQRKMLLLTTEMFPAANLGQRGMQRPLLEIDATPILPDDAEVAWREVAQSWGEPMVTELKRKASVSARRSEEVQTAKALSLELLAHQAPFNWIYLKQYRDAFHIENACYQAVVLSTRSITRVYDWREIEEPIHVRVHRSPGHPIVETLGLAVKRVDSTPDGVVSILQPARPFWMRIGLQEDLGKVIAWRAGDGTQEWIVHRPRSSEAQAHGVTSEADARCDTIDRSPLRRAEGQTRVGSVLGEKRRLDRDLEGSASHWLRQALTHQLARMRRAYLQEQRDAPTRGQSQHPLLRPEHVKQLFESDLDTLQTDTMLELTRALVAAGVGEADSPPSRAAASTANASQSAADESDPDMWKRLTYEDARQTIEAFDELQVVIESILSDEWENRAPSSPSVRRRKPAHFVPAGSVYGTGDTLKAQREEFLKQHGLKEFENLWGLPPTESEEGDAG